MLIVLIEDNAHTKFGGEDYLSFTCFMCVFVSFCLCFCMSVLSLCHMAELGALFATGGSLEC